MAEFDIYVDEHGNLLLNQHEVFYFECKADTPAVKGKLFFTNQRIVFAGKEKLSRGISAPKGVFGLAAVAIRATANIASRAKGFDTVQLQIPMNNIQKYKIKGTVYKTLEIQIPGKKIEFAISHGDVTQIQTSLIQARANMTTISTPQAQRPPVIDKSSQEFYSSETEKLFRSTRSQPTISIANSSFQTQIQSLDYYEISNKFDELELRKEIGELTSEEYEIEIKKLEENLPKFTTQDLEELALRVEIGEIPERKFRELTGRPLPK
ncbi:MAG: hypothetical protein ACTSPV_18160 [Candidatus Hodarchaeales archaeon]